MSLSLTFNGFHALFRCFHCWLGTSNCRKGCMRFILMINVSFLRIILFGSRFYGLSGKAPRQFQGPYYQVSYLVNMALILVLVVSCLELLCFLIISKKKRVGRGVSKDAPSTSVWANMLKNVLGKKFGMVWNVLIIWYSKSTWFRGCENKSFIVGN